MVTLAGGLAGAALLLYIALPAAPGAPLWTLRRPPCDIERRFDGWTEGYTPFVALKGVGDFVADAEPVAVRRHGVAAPFVPVVPSTGAPFAVAPVALVDVPTPAGDEALSHYLDLVETCLHAGLSALVAQTCAVLQVDPASLTALDTEKETHHARQGQRTPAAVARRSRSGKRASGVRRTADVARGRAAAAAATAGRRALDTAGDRRARGMVRGVAATAALRPRSV